MNAMTFGQKPGKPQDTLELTALVRGTVASGVERRVLLLPLSRLPRTDHPLVREVLAPLQRPNRARLFDLPNGDIVAVSPPPGDHLDRAFLHLATFFDGLGESEGPRQLCLPQEATAVLAAIEQSLIPPERRPPAALLTEAGEQPPAPSGFTAAQLAALEAGLASAGLAAFLRRSVIHRLEAGGEGAIPVQEEIRVALPELVATLAPGVGLDDAPRLHRRLRRVVDRRLLRELARPEDIHAGLPAILPLLPSTLAEVEFLRFDTLLGPTGRQRTTISFTAPDILADPAGFAFARDVAQARGYRLALDSAGAIALPLRGADQLGAGLLVLRWSPGLAALPEESLRSLLPVDRGRVVLTGIDRPAAIGWAWEQGITLFEGRLVARGWSAI